MVDWSADEEREVRRKQAHALVDAVIDVDARRATGVELSGLMVARAKLAAITDGAAVAAMAQWEASADWASDGSATAVTFLANHTGAHRGRDHRAPMSSVWSVRQDGYDEHSA